MRRRQAMLSGIALAAVLVFGLAAYGGYTLASAAAAAGPAAAPVEAAAPAKSESPVAVTVGTAASELGEILVDGEGRTLYRFLQDEAGVSTCTDGCLANWPPLVAQGEPQAGGAADATLLDTIQPDSATTQVTYAQWPLYTFAGDSAPGNVNGQGVGGTWYVVAPDGSPILPEPAVTVGTAASELGEMLVDGEGRTLYRFLRDTAGVSTCTGECLDAWPALVADDEVQAAGAADATLLGTIQPSYTTTQVTYAQWPLYTFAGDTAPGQVNGQGVGGTWYVVAPDGSPIRPAPEPEPAGVAIGTATSELGEMLVDGEGRTLYRFMEDPAGTSTCTGECLEKWPALVSDGEVQLTGAADAGELGTAERDDGTVQVTYCRWPLYTFAGDSAPGEINGQGVGGFLAVAPDGSAIRTAG